MASIQAGRFSEVSPGFSLSPKYSQTTPNDVVAITDQTSSDYGPLHFLFNLLSRNQSPGTTNISDIKTSREPFLLAIPLEIRLQIYELVFLSHPISHSYLAPSTPEIVEKEVYRDMILTHQGLSQPSSISRLSQPQHFQGQIPTSLLLSCKQIYNESYRLPFTKSHFTFSTWFHSGVYAANQFTRSLRPWQRAAIRHVSVEVLARDLESMGMRQLRGVISGGATSEQGRGEWRNLCALWEGVRNLRLRIKGNVVVDGKREMEKKYVDLPKARGRVTDADQKTELMDRGILDVQMEWVMDGILKMKSLQSIELEIDDEHLDLKSKVAFCAELENSFGELRNGGACFTGNVKVVFVERVPNKQRRKLHIIEPGDAPISYGES